MSSFAFQLIFLVTIFSTVCLIADYIYARWRRRKRKVKND